MPVRTVQNKATFPKQKNKNLQNSRLLWTVKEEGEVGKKTKNLVNFRAALTRELLS